MDRIIIFFYLIGLIIGLGAVTVIDWMGFLSRKDKKMTEATIMAHHITKPLIWVGTSLILIALIIEYVKNPNSNLIIYKFLLLFLMILNGSFLSFYVSPRLNKLQGKNLLLPPNLQTKIAFSMIISFISWWTLVILTVLTI